MKDDGLSRRERQIMDVLYARSEASVADVIADLPDPPSYSAVRALLRIMETKGHLSHREIKGKYIYRPVRGRTLAARSALRKLVNTFFAGSPEKACAALLESSDTALSDTELDRLAQLIDNARQQGK